MNLNVGYCDGETMNMDLLFVCYIYEFTICSVFLYELNYN